MSEPVASTPDPSSDLASFGAAFAENRPNARVTRQLFALLTSMRADQDEWDQLLWLERCARWLHRGASMGAKTDGRAERLAFLVRAVSGVPTWRATFASIATSMLSEAQGVRVFSDVGLPVEPRFWHEALDRVAQKFVPAAPEPRRLAHLLLVLFPRPQDADWLANAPRELLRSCVSLFAAPDAAPDAPWRALRASMADAIAVLAARVCAQGIAQDVRDRLPETLVRDLPFLKLPRACDALNLHSAPAPSPDAVDTVRDVVHASAAAITEVHSHLDQFGLSVDLVYRLELISAQLARLQELLAIAVPGYVSEAPRDIPALLASLVRAQFEMRSVRALLRQSSQRLARKVIERAGNSGEHYITETRREWFGMLGSAGGGGVLTAGTAAIKFVVAAFKMAPFFVGFCAAINYAASFVVMQWLGFTLATKQPSMTAAALAASIGQNTGVAGINATQSRRLDKLVDMIARITRSQFAAAVGNVGFVIPTCALLDAVWVHQYRHHFLDAHQAEHVVASLHLFRSPTLGFAALTGVFLWMASVAAGWLENWAVYRKLPIAIAHHRLLTRIVGRARAAKIADSVLHGIAGFGGNVSLGFILGMAPIACAFFGIPIEVRHVTLSTGSLTLSACTTGMQTFHEAEYLWAAVGCIAIGVLNFGVSFVLALVMALRAREVRARDVFVLFRTVIARGLRSPGTFLFPPGAQRPAPNADALAKATVRPPKRH